MKKRILSMLLSAALCFSLIPAPAFAAERGVQINDITFPDQGFREHIENIYDDDSNGFLSEDELNETISMIVEGTSAKNLKGIEYFDRIANLYCDSNYQLESADLSKNSQLEIIRLNDNKLKEVVVGTLPVLRELSCTGNSLTSLDITRCPVLEQLWCTDNKITKLDVSKNPKLEILYCVGNELKTLDVSKNPELVKINAKQNYITSINTEKNTKLETCYYMPKVFEMPVRENLSLEELPTFLDDVYSVIGNTLSGDGLIIDENNKTISLEEGKDEGTLYVSDYYGKESYKLFYRYPVKDVSIEGLDQVNSSTYKTEFTGKEISVEPVVKDENNQVLEKDKDYTLELDKEKILKPGAYTLTVKGIGKYKGTISNKIVVTPEPVKNAAVRLRAKNPGGYNDVYVTWDKSEGADGYQIYMRRPEKTSKWTLVKAVKGTEDSYVKTDLASGYKYQVKVIPYVYSDDVKYRTTDGYKRLNVITLKKASRPKVVKSKGAAKVSWNSVVGRSGYQIAVTRKGKTSYYKTANTSRTFNFKNTKVTYKVRAYKTIKTSSGKDFRVFGPWSDSRSFTLR